ncbi:MAG: VWA domain-containing protein [Gammaproteobacteria bacterium]|nr:VWA domain-containing protein [Gammaproteobacteria bacterium]
MPNIILNNKLLISACFLLNMLSVPVYAENNPAQDKLPLDTVVIMDSSGSMKQTDPKQLRKPAAKLFISLLDNQDRLSVVSFSSKAWPITYLTQLESDKQLNQALRATDKISHKGMYTNIHSAIAKGIEFLKESDQINREPIIILMSDGQMDVGNKEQSAQLREKIFEDLLPQLIEHNIKIYSIAFTEASDQELLQEVADATDGRYALAASDDVLHKVFSKIFEQTKQPDMLPLNENKFIVDASINEITIIANKASENSQIYLQPPGGEKINSTFKSEKVKWFVSTSFDMITIQKPDEGEWKILFSDDDNRAYIVTDIKLRTRFEFNQESYQPEIIIKSWFLQNEETEAGQELLNNMQVTLEIEHPDDTIETFPVDAANEAGEFIIHYKPLLDGVYGASIIAKSRTFQRQQTFSFKNSMPTEPEIIEEPVKEPEIEKPPVVEPEPVPVDDEEGEDTTKMLIYFGIFNVVLIFIGLNGFLIYRHFKSNKTSSTNTSKEE